MQPSLHPTRSEEIPTKRENNEKDHEEEDDQEKEGVNYPGDAHQPLFSFLSA